MWWASALLAAPNTSPRIVAPRRSATDHSSSISTAAPSPSTNPSRSASNGRLDPDVDSAVMLPKLATPMVQPADSVPPVTTASHIPQEIRRAAYPMAWVDAAQAVVIVSFGPRKPYRIEIAAPEALDIIIGTRNGDTRRGPLARRTSIWSEVERRPPTPVAKMVPKRCDSTSGRPACSKASAAAARANCSTLSARRASFGLSKYGCGSQSAISMLCEPVIPGPLRPSQNAFFPIPQGATTP